MRKVLLVHNIPALEVALNLYFTKQAFCKASFLRFDTKVNDFDNFIIIEPFLIQDKYITIYSVWKDFLSINLPDSKLVIMGFGKYQSENYIDLLDLPLCQY